MGGVGYLLGQLLLGVVAIVTSLWLLTKRTTSSLRRLQAQDGSRPALEVLYPDPPKVDADVEIDILAVHGLGSNVDWSWTWKGELRNVNWLKDQDMLPSVVPKARVMVYSYDSKWHLDAPRSRLSIVGEDLIRSVHRHRQGCPDRPIIFIGHSLGGNVIINGLLYANGESEFSYLPNLIVGLVFLGSPFRGTRSQALPDLIARIMSPAGSHRGMIKDLDYDNPVLLDTLHAFCGLRNSLSIPVSCFFELYQTDYGRRVGVAGVAKEMIVDEASATIPGLKRFALQTDHFKINKFPDPKDRSFRSVSEEIRVMNHNAKDVVKRRKNPSAIITDRNYFLTRNPEGRYCLRDLFVADPFEHKDALKRKKGERAPDTCKWILGTQELTAWLEAGLAAEVILWLFGNPGTGKSTMSIFLAEELSKVFSTTNGKTLAYFFCDSTFEERRTATAILRGLLLQLVQQHPHLLTYVLPKYNERGAILFESFDALWPIFMSMVTDKSTGRKYCIIDALDECDLESQKTLLRQFGQTFGHCDSELSSNIRILVTSRPYPEIEKYLSRFANKDLASFSESRRDVELFIDTRVAELAIIKKYTAKVKEQITKILKEKAEGTFLWVGLACTELEQVDSKDALKFLQGLPEELHSLYRRLLNMASQSKNAGTDSVKCILTFVALSFQPLSLMELSSACQLHQDQGEEERIQFMREEIASCRLMVIIHDGKVLLLHQSVKDFLVGSSSESSSDHFIDKFEAHAALARRCVDRLIQHFHEGDMSWNDGFLSYAKEYWTGHAHSAQSEFKVHDDQAEFFSVDSMCREHWLERLRSDRRPTIPRSIHSRCFSIFHIASHYDIPALVEYVYSRGDRDNRYSGYNDLRWRTSAGVTPMQEAVIQGHVKVLSCLLDHEARDIKEYEHVVKAAVGSSGSGVEIIELLLNRRGDQIAITEEIMIVAAENFRYGAEMIAFLLDRRGDQITITEEIVKAAAGNFQYGAEMIALLLDRRGDQITITEEIVKEATGNWNEKVMALLLDRRGDQIIVTEEIVKAVVAGNCFHGEKTFTLLLNRCGDQITITEKIVKTAAENDWWGQEVMTLLLDQRGDQIIITEEIVKAAARNLSEQVMTLLLDRRGDQIIVTEEIVKTAARNSREKVMALLLDRRGVQIIVTEETVKAAARNSSEKVMALLLDRRGDQIIATEEILKEAARNWNAEVMALLLDRRRDQIIVTEKIVKTAAGNPNGKNVIRLLLERCGDQIAAEWLETAGFNKSNSNSALED